MAVGIISFKITGKSALLMNNPESMKEEDPSKTKSRLKTKEYKPEEEAKIRLYTLNKKGELYIPAICVLNSMWEGASYEKIGKDSARNRIQSAVFVVEEKVPLLDQKTGEPIREYTIDSRHVVIQSGSKRNRIMRQRPKVDNWMCIVPFEVDTDYISEEQLVHLLNKSGRTIGVMDYRPSKRGPFGRYTAELYVPEVKKKK